MLIDGDNAQPSLIEHVLAETAKYGVVTTRRIYGDWTTPQMSGWKDSLHSHAVQPMQQFRYTTGKNATDSALIIDAMDLLHAGTVRGFCIVSSDSDYTRLATRIREGGLFVMGVGRSDTPKSFVNACEVFVYTENLAPQGKRGTQVTETDSSDWTAMVRRAIRDGRTGRRLGIPRSCWHLFASTRPCVRRSDLRTEAIVTTHHIPSWSVRGSEIEDQRRAFAHLCEIAMTPEKEHSRIARAAERQPPIHPGEVLNEEFLLPMNLSR